MTETPDVAILIVFMAVCAWAVYHGLQVVTRYSSFFVSIAVIFLVVATIFTINLMKLENFLPMFDQPVMNYVQGTNIILMIPFGEIIVFLMIAPCVFRPKKGGGLGKYVLGGFAIGGMTLLSVVFRDTAVLGNTLGLFSLPSFETLRMVSVSEALSRMEILFAIVLVVLLFFKVMMLYYITAIAARHLLNLKSHRPLVLVIGAFSIVYALLLFSSNVDHCGLWTRDGAHTLVHLLLVFAAGHADCR